jgi:hypothetical protein
MQKHYIDISKESNIKDLYNAASLFADKKNDEIVILVDEADYLDSNLSVLKGLYTILGEGMLNYDISGNKPKQNFDNNAVAIFDYNVLALELSKLTGVKFSVSLINKENNS